MVKAFQREIICYYNQQTFEEQQEALIAELRTLCQNPQPPAADINMLVAQLDPSRSTRARDYLKEQHTQLPLLAKKTDYQSVMNVVGIYSSSIPQMRGDALKCMQYAPDLFEEQIKGSLQKGQNKEISRGEWYEVEWAAAAACRAGKTYKQMFIDIFDLQHSDLGRANLLIGCMFQDIPLYQDKLSNILQTVDDPYILRKVSKYAAHEAFQLEFDPEIVRSVYKKDGLAGVKMMALRPDLYIAEIGSALTQQNDQELLRGAIYATDKNPTLFQAQLQQLVKTDDRDLRRTVLYSMSKDPDTFGDTIITYITDLNVISGSLVFNDMIDKSPNFKQKLTNYINKADCSDEVLDFLAIAFTDHNSNFIESIARVMVKRSNINLKQLNNIFAKAGDRINLSEVVPYLLRNRKDDLLSLVHGRPPIDLQKIIQYMLGNPQLAYQATNFLQEIMDKDEEGLVFGLCYCLKKEQGININPFFDVISHKTSGEI